VADSDAVTDWDGAVAEDDTPDAAGGETEAVTLGSAD
jgi:hypothetical protein